MSEKNPHTPGTPEWQAWLDAKIAEHDQQHQARNQEIDEELRQQAHNEINKQSDT